MTDHVRTEDRLSPWWRMSVLIVMILGFAILIWIAVVTPRDAPPIPVKVVTKAGDIIFTSDDIISGQEVFLKYGLMENGTVWGHGAYLGPDFSAEYLHALADEAKAVLSQSLYGRPVSGVTQFEHDFLNAEVQRLLKTNRFDPHTGVLTFTPAEAVSYRSQIEKWGAYFYKPEINRGLLIGLIHDPDEIRQLTSFFAWTAWASAANRPGKDYSYTNNFPYDPAVGNRPTAGVFLWSALSLIALLAGTAAVLFVFGKFDFLGWKGTGKHIHPQLLPGEATESQRATIKFFAVAGLLFLAQVLVGGATAHYRVDPGSFYGLNFPQFFSSNIFRTWHLQTAIFWIATSYIAGGLFLAAAFRQKEPGGQTRGINILFSALVLVMFGSLFGEMFGVFQLAGKVWFWFGHQGWEYLDLGRAWQFMLVAGFFLWLLLLVRAVGPARSDPQDGEMVKLFIFAAAAIPLFYLPAVFYTGKTHFSVVDMWRFWIIHLWVEGFFELFVTAMIAVLFYKLGMVTRLTATRVIYLDAILFLAGGIVGTGHHWYWTGQANISMALSAMFSALEVVPLTLLTLDAWDFVKLSSGTCDICGREISIPHRWTFYFLMAVGFWNFVGAGIFGFLINMPIVSYFEVGTILTPNHGHSALMGVFGMFAVAFMVFAMRQVLPEERWTSIEKFVRISFWGLNIGLALMVILNLFPGGVLQLWDVLENGYWHARSVEFLDRGRSLMIEWARLPADAIFIVFGVIPLFIAMIKAYACVRKQDAKKSG
ncbi:MAG TPA: cbb3-type cytochrome c oxidase subunit I [Syntrophales bacterium]|nr:cbb3-type cytochrome c oxidase subunit I [Syntrophales bacterium]